ncbi:MAG: DUF885 domain-containing protein [Clostridiaceae bacterium]|nr:DUF885 domain-containing protein [Clostridiaceae bacterium]
MKRDQIQVEWKDASGKRGKRRIRIFALCLCLIALGGIIYYQGNNGQESLDTITHPKVEDSRTEEEAQSDFDELIQEIFREEVTDDSVTLNYIVKDREAYGIEEIEPTLGDYTTEALEASLMVSENRVATLETYDYDKLTQEQQLIYDIIYLMYQQNLESADFIEYTEYLSPTSGLQAQLPVLLSEYNFYGKEEVEEYLALVALVPDCFEQILEMEKKKSEDGIFMSDTTVQAIIDQCNELIKTPEDFYLISVFDKRIKEVDGLTQKEQETYSEKNKEAILNKMIPAYETLVKGLKKLKGTGKNENGLSYLEKGKEYYTYLVKRKTGSSRTPEEIEELLDEKIKEETSVMAQIVSEKPDAYYDAQDVTYEYDTPQTAMEHLKTAILKDFPALDDSISCEIKTVDESQEEYMSPAFYLTPAIDNYTDNIMYINNSDEYDLSKAFTTIAHEGYPGHLYQTCYFNETNPNPLRSLIEVSGYTEGWATYAEVYSYDLAEIDQDVADLLCANTLTTLYLYAKADLGVNYLGWDYDELNEYLEDYGFSKSSTRTIFDSMVAEPAAYMPYALGYLEIEALLDEAQDSLGDKFVLKDFHEFFLSIGPSPFAVIQDRLQDWIDEQKNA